MGKSSPPQKVSTFSESNCPVSEAKQNQTRSAQDSVARNAGRPCMGHQNARVLEKGELLPIVEDAPIPIREHLETAGVNPAQRGDAEAAPICSEEQNLLLVYLTQTRA